MSDPTFCWHKHWFIFFLTTLIAMLKAFLSLCVYVTISFRLHVIQTYSLSPGITATSCSSFLRCVIKGAVYVCVGVGMRPCLYLWVFLPFGKHIWSWLCNSAARRQGNQKQMWSLKLGRWVCGRVGWSPSMGDVHGQCMPPLPLLIADPLVCLSYQQGSIG